MNNTINQMLINIKRSIFIALAVIVMVPAVSFAEPSTSDSSNAASSAPSVSDSSNAAVTGSTPSTSDSSNAAVTGSTPSTSDSSNASVTSGNTGSTPKTSDSSNAAVTGSKPNNTSGGGSNNNSGGSSGSRSHSSGSVSSSLVSTVFVANNSTCPYLNSYLITKGQNDSNEVVKLQTFLKNNEKLNVDINGKFDQKTIDAVKSFQTKYVNETMAPWGVKTPTGNVFYTTKKKINEIVCKTNIALTATEVSGIESYKNSLITDTKSTTPSGSENVVGTTGSTTNSQVASPANTSVAGKVWKFTKWLFGY